MRSWKRSRSATYPPGSGGCSADPGAPAGKERTVSFGVGSVTARFLWRLGNAPADFARGPCSSGGSIVGFGQGGRREDRACRTRHLFLPRHGTERVVVHRIEPLRLSYRRTARDRTEACGCTSQGKKGGPAPSRDQTGRSLAGSTHELRVP